MSFYPKTHIKFDHLYFFITAADHGSFRRAAESMLLRQSSLSRKIRELEDIIGIKLFERSSAGVRPTRAGRAFLESARSILEQMRALPSVAHEGAVGTTDNLSIGFGGSLSHGELRAVLTEYASRFPDTRVNLVEHPRSRLVAALRAGDLDIAVMMEGGLEPDLRSAPLWDEKLIVALPATHPLAQTEAIPWPVISGETILLSRQDLGLDLRDHLHARFGQSGSPPCIQLQDISRSSIKHLVSAGGGISLTTEAGIGTGIAGLVYRDLLDGTEPVRIRHVACWKDGNGNAALTHFLDLLRERYPSLATG